MERLSGALEGAPESCGVAALVAAAAAVATPIKKPNDSAIASPRASDALVRRLRPVVLAMPLGRLRRCGVGMVTDSFEIFLTKPDIIDLEQIVKVIC